MVRRWDTTTRRQLLIRKAKAPLRTIRGRSMTERKQFARGRQHTADDVSLPRSLPVPWLAVVKGSNSNAGLHCQRGQGIFRDIAKVYEIDLVAQNEDVDGPGRGRSTSNLIEWYLRCLLYTSPSPRDGLLSRMPSSA